MWRVKILQTNAYNRGKNEKKLALKNNDKIRGLFEPQASAELLAQEEPTLGTRRSLCSHSAEELCTSSCGCTSFIIKTNGKGRTVSYAIKVGSHPILCAGQWEEHVTHR